MSLLDQIRADVLQITTNTDEYGQPITFDNGTVSVTVNGRANKHHLSIDRDGNATNAKNASISVSEQALTTLSFPVRDASGEVNLKNVKVTWTDSTSTPRTYMIRQWYPDEVIGYIVCILGDFK